MIKERMKIVVLCLLSALMLFGCSGGTDMKDNGTNISGNNTETVGATETTGGGTEVLDYGLELETGKDLISICYSIWFDGVLGGGTDPVTTWYNVTEVLAGKQTWGPSPAFHYWAKPAQGYYRSSDKNAALNNMTLLGEADVDFVILDMTNHANWDAKGTARWNDWVYNPIKTLLDAINELRAEGKKTPYVCLWMGYQTCDKLVYDVYNEFVLKEEYRDCFVYKKGKPFFLTAGTAAEFARNEDGRDEYGIARKLAVKRMWGLTTESRIWRFLNTDNKGTACMTLAGEAEQLSVAVASQETYMTDPNAHGRNGGKFFYEQWTEAFKVHPKVVTITWWNEWVAQRFIDENGNSRFVDNYNIEYSRDIEPMEGGHGDQYYKWMCEYIRAYKNHEECPKLYEE